MVEDLAVGDGDSASEVCLEGGNTSEVVRSGGTVRRVAGPWTAAVHGLLRHLERVGFEGAPRVLGFDDRGREVLTFLPGDVAFGSPWPAKFWAEATLEQVGRLLARYHQAVRDYRPDEGSYWWYSVGAPAMGEVICHNDAAPYNTVVSEDRVVGFIDWDVAGPAKPRWDLAFAVWQWVPLHHPALQAELGAPGERLQVRRLRLLCRAYGEADPGTLLPLVRARVAASRDGVQSGADRNDPVMVRLSEEGHLEDMDRTLGYIDARLPRLAEILGLACSSSKRESSPLPPS